MKVPCVLHMDSIRGSHTGLKGLVQSYLKEEWKERQQGTSEDVSLRFDNLRFISLELPQQQNSFDCGLFLLHYVELFLEQTPLHFNPFKITNSSNFLNVDWFPPADASLKRVVIQRLICDLLENPHQESSTAGNDERCNLSCSATNVQKGGIVNLPAEDCNASMPHQNSHADLGVEISLIPSSDVHCADDPSGDLKSSFESGSFLATRFPSFNHATNFDDYKSSLAPIEEDVEGGGQFVFSGTESGLQQDGGIIMPDDSVLPYSSQELRTQEPWHTPVMTEHEIENNNFKSSPETSTSGCDDSIEIVDENSQVDSELSLKKRSDQPRSPIPDTLSEYVQAVDGNRDDDHTSSMDPIQGSQLTCPDAQGTSPTGSENSPSDVQQHPTKKMRMTEA